MGIFLPSLVGVPIRSHFIPIVGIWRLILMSWLDLSWFTIIFLLYFLVNLAFHLILWQSLKIDKILSTSPGHLLPSPEIISIVVTPINVDNIGTWITSRRRRPGLSDYNLGRFDNFLRLIRYESALMNAESWFIRIENLLVFNPRIVLFNRLFFERRELPIDPDRQLLQIHPLIEIIVQHIGNNTSNTLIVMFLHHLQSFRNHIIKYIVVWAVEALAAG